MAEAEAGVPPDMDVHATARRVAVELLASLGFAGADVASLVESVSLTGSRRPFLPSPWKISELALGAQVAIAALCQVVSRSRLGAPQAVSVDADHAALCLYLGYVMQWDLAGGRLIEILKKITDVPPPEGSCPPFLFLTGNSYMCRDRWIHVFSSYSAPADFLKVFGFTDAEAADLVALAHCVPDYVNTDWPATWARQKKVVAAIRAKARERSAWELEAEFQRTKIGAVCVPLTGAEFDASEQGRALRAVPPIEVRRFEGWPAAPLGPLDSDAARGRGLLAGVKVLELTRVLMGPTIGLNLANYGATSIRISSAAVGDAPFYSFAMNTNKRSIFLDLKLPADKARAAALLADADIIIQNNAFGAVERLGFGLQDVLSLVRGRNKGIVYVEGNSFGFSGPMAASLGFEQLGQMLTGLCAGQAAHQPCSPDPGPAERPPALLPTTACDVTTGTFGALGALAALARREREGGSYLVRVSLARTAVALRDLGMYEDETAIADLMAAYPPLDLSDDVSSPHFGINHLNNFYTKIIERRPELFDTENGMWQTFRDCPFGGTLVNLRPPITLSATPSVTRLAPRPIGHDPLEGWDEPEELVREGEGHVYVPAGKAGAARL